MHLWEILKFYNLIKEFLVDKFFSLTIFLAYVQTFSADI